VSTQLCRTLSEINIVVSDRVTENSAGLDKIHYSTKKKNSAGLDKIHFSTKKKNSAGLTKYTILQDLAKYIPIKFRKTFTKYIPVCWCK
jgi:hypothetical protein